MCGTASTSAADSAASVELARILSSSLHLRRWYHLVMLNRTTLDSAALGDFSTTMDYVLTDDGELAYLYDVSLSEVERQIIEWENRIVSLS